MLGVLECWEHSQQWVQAVDDAHIWQTIELALEYAKAGEGIGTRNNTALLDELDRVGTYWAMHSPSRASSQNWSDPFRPCEQRGGFLAKAASYCLVSHVSAKLAVNNTILLDFKRTQSLLNSVL